MTTLTQADYEFMQMVFKDSSGFPEDYAENVDRIFTWASEQL